MIVVQSNFWIGSTIDESSTNGILVQDNKLYDKIPNLVEKTYTIGKITRM